MKEKKKVEEEVEEEEKEVEEEVAEEAFEIVVTPNLPISGCSFGLMQLREFKNKTVDFILLLFLSLSLSFSM